MKKIIAFFCLIGIFSLVTAQASSQTSVTEFDINFKEVRPLLTQDQIFDVTAFNNSAYVVAQAGEHISSSMEDKIYVRGIKDNVGADYLIFRKSDIALVDDDSKQPTQILALNVGSARVVSAGDPATLTILHASRPINIGDRLLPKNAVNTDLNFALHYPQAAVNGKVLAIVSENLGINLQAVLLVDQGTEQGLKAGDLLAIYQKGDVIKDPVKTDKQETVTLPDKQVAKILVFRAYDKYSFALVVQQDAVPHLADKVGNI